MNSDNLAVAGRLPEIIPRIGFPWTARKRWFWLTEGSWVSILLQLSRFPQQSWISEETFLPLPANCFGSCSGDNDLCWLLEKDRKERKQIPVMFSRTHRLQCSEMHYDLTCTMLVQVEISCISPCYNQHIGEEIVWKIFNVGNLLHLALLLNRQWHFQSERFLGRLSLSKIDRLIQL